MMTKKIIAMKNYLRMRNEGLKDFLREEDGVGVVEVILILVEKYFISYSLQILQKEYICVCIISILSIIISVSIRRESYMFTYKELHLIDKGYFKVLRYPIEDNFIEIQSKNTRDSWIIQKRNPNVSDYPVILYHKHPGQKYYHKHWQCYNVSQCIRSIKSHDEYSMFRKWNERLEPKRIQRRIHRQQPQLQQGI